jgi:pyrimidine-nucleoside phosphorylase
MSKKIATGASAVVLDVKVGAGAFMKDLASARALAQAMVALGRGVGLPAVAVLSAMDEPLGAAVGNALEVREAIETLQGHGPADLVELCLALGSEVLVTAGAAESAEAAREQLGATLADGSALAKLRALVAGLGGDVRCVEEPDRLPAAPYVVDVLAPRDGYVARIDALAIGLAAMQLGAGRATKQDTIDPAVGVVLRAKIGDGLTRGQPLATIYARRPPRPDAAGSVDSASGAAQALATSPTPTSAAGDASAADLILGAVQWGQSPAPRPPLVLDVIR